MADPTASLAALGLTAKGGREAQVTGLAVDSRALRNGFLFAALPGSAAHGAQFIPQALRQGASAILTDPEGARLAQEALADSDAALVIAEDARAALAWSAALWFRDQPTTVVATQVNITPDREKDIMREWRSRLGATEAPALPAATTTP
jgi:UDP-N-acetylmuramoyl-L-alanyl-D-glutamate--2,6-diaminopimelate ligase